MKKVTKQDDKMNITITYKNEPSQSAIRIYAEKLKKIIDTKMQAG